MGARTVEHRPADAGRPPLRIERSTRRRKSASAYAEHGAVVLQLPAGLAAAEEDRLIAELVDKVTGARRARELGGDDELAARARALADAYLDGVRAASVTWSSRMRRRYGSCTPRDGTIRISERLARYPRYVLDYVLVHELAHLLEPDHSDGFQALIARFPDADRARGFLAGVAHAQAGAPPPPGESSPPDGSSVESSPSPSPASPPD